MKRRDFLKIGGVGLLSIPFSRLFGSPPPQPPVSVKPEETLWIHGSPYLGHSDLRENFRGMSPKEIRLQIGHFRTPEPWRRKMLFHW